MRANDAKVAWVTPRLGRNGKLLYMEPLLSGLAKACKEFHIFTVEYGGNCNHPDFGITCEGGIKMLNEGVASSGAPTGIPLISPAIIKRIYRYRPDVILLNEFGLLTVYGVLLSLFLRRIKILLVVENRPIANGTPLYRKFRNLFRRIIAHCADAVLTNNIDGRTYLIDELGVDPDRIISRPYLTSDMSQYLPETDRVDLEKTTRTGRAPIHFIYAGRLIQSKGVSHALEAFHIMLEKHRGRFLFDIVGDGPDREMLEDLTRRLDLSDHVSFLGHQPYGALATLYREADVFLFPTLADYRSLVCFEAMSVGLPIVASIYDGGSVETVINGENGYTFDPHDHRHLAELLSRFIDDPELIQRLSSRSLAMSRNYTLPRAVESGIMAIDLALASP